MEETQEEEEQEEEEDGEDGDVVIDVGTAAVSFFKHRLFYDTFYF